MAFENITLTLTGMAPLIQHNNQAANPLNAYKKRMSAITSKRKKTDEDHEALARIEFEAGLYWNDELGPYMPAQNVEKCLVVGARLRKLGKELIRSVFVTDDVPVDYDGPRSVQALYDAGFYDQRIVKNQTSSVVRTRPIFPKWRLVVPVQIDTSRLDIADLRGIAEDAGLYEGMGDYRPRFGRFTAAVVA